MSAIEIWPEIERKNSSTLISGVFEGLPQGTKKIWFELPYEVDPSGAAIGHALFLAGLFAAMQKGGTCRLHGTIGRSALANMAELNAIWSAWRPGHYQQVELQPDSTTSEQELRGRDHRGWILAFSGGIDSCASLWRHTRGDIGWRRRPIGATVCVHGLDVPLSDDIAFERLKCRASAITGSLGVRFVAAKTNIRELHDKWDDSHGSKLSAILHLFSSGYEGGVIASSQPYAFPILPWGSTPVTDAFFGSATFPIFYDGAELTRLEKVRLVHTWQACLENVRVCWQAHSKGVNCGKCEKCVRTQLEFACFGVKYIPAFDGQLTTTKVHKLTVTNAIQFAHLQELVAWCKEHGLRPEWLPALERVVKKGVSPAKASILRRAASRIRGVLKVNELTGGAYK